MTSGMPTASGVRGFVVRFRNPPPALTKPVNKVVQHSALCRFLLYAENRVLVRTALGSHGFKKVRAGVERVAVMQRGAADDSSNYEQRPSISFSWEKEESKNRHVDFQFVRKAGRASR